MKHARLLLATALCALAGASAAGAAEEPSAGPQNRPKSAWSKSTELGDVLTQGNSNAESLAFKDTFEYKPVTGRMRL